MMRPMTFERILVGYDAGETAEDALALAVLIADRAGAKLTLGTVAPIPATGTNPLAGGASPVVPLEAQTELDAKIRAGLEPVAARVGGDFEVEQSTSPARGLESLGERIAADLIVLGSSPQAKEGHTRAGKEARHLMSGGAAAVAIAPEGFRDRAALDRIGVGIDGSPESELALETAAALAEGASDFQLLAAAAGFADEWGRWGVTYPMAEMAEATRGAAEELLARTARELPESLGARQMLLEGTAPIRLAEASKNLDLLCLGSRAYGPVRRVLLGSVSSDTVNHAASAVLVVPGTGQSED